MLLGVSLGSIVTIAYPAFRSGNQALTESVFDHLTSALRSLAGFASLEEAALKTLAEGARLLHYATGETALDQGEPCGALCVVSDGVARMSLCAKAGDEREVMELRLSEAFGEGALLKEERSPVTVAAMSDLTVVALDTAALEADPGLAPSSSRSAGARCSGSSTCQAPKAEPRLDPPHVPYLRGGLRGNARAVRDVVGNSGGRIDSHGRS